MRILLSLAAMFLLATFAPAGLFREPALPAQAKLWFEPVPLDADNPARTRLGRLVYLGGWSLRSDDPRYGGISAMHVEDGEVLALSDAGNLFRHALPARRQGIPLSVRPILDGPGDPRVKKNRDTEAMVVHRRRIWVAFERRNMIWRYARDTLAGQANAAPAPMRNWYENSGSEAMLRLPDGRFLVMSERSRRGDRFSDVLLFDGDPTASSTGVTQLVYRGPDGYRATDAALLPDGRLLILHRRFSYLAGISAKLTVASMPEAENGLVFSGEEIASFDPPVTLDNLEALSVTQDNGRTILWIASDNNFTALQRTLLLKFALAE